MVFSFYTICYTLVVFENCFRQMLVINKKRKWSSYKHTAKQLSPNTMELIRLPPPQRWPSGYGVLGGAYGDRGVSGGSHMFLNLLKIGATQHSVINL